MKKILFTLSVLFVSFSTSFAYNNNLAVFCASYDAEMSAPTSDTKVININENCELFFISQWTKAGDDMSTTNGYAYFKNNGSTVLTNAFYSGVLIGPPSYVSTGYWGVVELSMNCVYNSIGLVQIYW